MNLDDFKPLLQIGLVVGIVVIALYYLDQIMIARQSADAQNQQVQLQNDFLASEYASAESNYLGLGGGFNNFGFITNPGTTAAQPGSIGIPGPRITLPLQIPGTA